MSNWQGVIQGYKEHNEMLMEMLAERGERISQLRDENARLRKALKFYAYDMNYVLWNSMAVSKTEIERDQGEIARRALEGQSNDR